MKFIADAKDWKMFGIFCFFLLYMCAIAVLNAHSLAVDGTFYGLVPFRAFTSDYIAATFTLFVLGLVGAFAGVSSYFFDREKGFGFSTTKKDKGYSRWAKDNEIKKELVAIDPKAPHAEAGGLPVINNGKKIWVDNGEAHNIIIGSTGSGKTQGVVFPLVHSLAKHDESMIITDPKGEIYEQTANMLRERGYNVVILNFRSPQNGNMWNPLTLPYQLYKEGNMDKSIEILDDLALNILYDENNKGDPFWEKASADYFSGLALGLFEDGSESQININSINLMSSLGEERYGGPNSNYMKEYFNSKDPSRPAYINASGVVYTAEETKQGVLATFKQKIKLFSSRDNLSAMLSRSDFDMKDIGRQKTAVFLIIQDEKKTLHPLATIFIKQAYETLIDVAQESGGPLKHRTNFILDEFANMPPLKDVTTMVTAARSRHIRFVFIIQNYAQLTQVYGKEEAETIKGNCNIMYLISSELTALEEISKMCGEVKSKEKEKTSSTPLVTVSDLQKLKMFEPIVLRLRLNPYKTKLTPNYKMDWGKKYEKATFPVKEKEAIDLFDIREFVKAQKKAKMEKMLGETMPSASSSTGSAPSLFDSLIPKDMLQEETVTNIPKESKMPNFGMGTSNGLKKEDIDDLVKRIDAQIAELEKEEEKERQAKLQAKSIPDIPKEVSYNDNVKDVMEFTNKEEKQVEEIKEEQIQESPKVDNRTPDEIFFDDFFSDE